MNSIKKPMLAGVAQELDQMEFPVAVTPKIDGIRCLKVDGKVISRTFKPIKNDFIRETLERILPDNADGEILAGKTFQECSSAVMKKDGAPKFTYCMFDYVHDHHDVGYMERMAAMSGWYEENKPSLGGYVRLLLPTIINNHEDLLALETKYLDEGYEGAMVRSLGSPYKNGRSTAREGYLLKIKRFSDSEAEIIGFVELMHNNNEATKDAFGRTERSSHKANKAPAGVLGKFVLKDLVTGVEFGCGTGLDASQRKKFWESQEELLGKAVKYKFFDVGVKDAPRHPVFLGFRDADDM